MGYIQMKTKIRNVLILVLIFIIGFGTGMVVTFEVVFKKLEDYGVCLWL